MSEEKKNQGEDWEMSEEYYKSGEGEKELSLEDFITEEDLQTDGMKLQSNHDELLKKTAEDVHRVMELTLQGNNIEKISEMTGLDSQYVYNILVCAQGFREDDEIAVANWHCANTQNKDFLWVQFGTLPEKEGLFMVL